MQIITVQLRIQYVCVYVLLLICFFNSLRITFPRCAQHRSYTTPHVVSHTVRQSSQELVQPKRDNKHYNGDNDEDDGNNDGDDNNDDDDRDDDQ